LKLGLGREWNSLNQEPRPLTIGVDFFNFKEGGVRLIILLLGYLVEGVYRYKKNWLTKGMGCWRGQ